MSCTRTFTGNNYQTVTPYSATWPQRKQLTFRIENFGYQKNQFAHTKSNKTANSTLYGSDKSFYKMGLNGHVVDTDGLLI